MPAWSLFAPTITGMSLFPVPATRAARERLDLVLTGVTTVSMYVAGVAAGFAAAEALLNGRWGPWWAVVSLVPAGLAVGLVARAWRSTLRILDPVQVVEADCTEGERCTLPAGALYVSVLIEERAAKLGPAAVYIHSHDAAPSRYPLAIGALELAIDRLYETQRQMN